MNDIDEIRDYTVRKLGHDDRWAVSCLKIIHERHMAGDNRYGFREQDHAFLASLAHRVVRGNKPTADQKWWIKHLMPDYWEQFVAAKGKFWIRERMREDALYADIKWPNVTTIKWTPEPEDIPLPYDFIRMIRLAQGIDEWTDFRS